MNETLQNNVTLSYYCNRAIVQFHGKITRKMLKIRERMWLRLNIPFEIVKSRDIYLETGDPARLPA
jgi:hypothetical protein